MVIDSGFFLSLEDPDERDHAPCRKVFQGLVADRVPLVTTNFVFDETYTLILTRLGRSRAVRWGESFLRSTLVQTVRVDEDHEALAWEIIVAFTDHDFSFTDATTFAVADSLGIAEALALDSHFRAYGRLNVLP